jgi:hypothetical protein
MLEPPTSSVLPRAVLSGDARYQGPLWHTSTSTEICFSARPGCANAPCLPCGNANDIVGHFAPIARSFARHVLIDLLERGIVVVAGEIPSIVDEDDVPGETMVENCVQFTENWRVLLRLSGDSAPD